MSSGYNLPLILLGCSDYISFVVDHVLISITLYKNLYILCDSPGDDTHIDGVVFNPVRPNQFLYIHDDWWPTGQNPVSVTKG